MFGKSACYKGFRHLGRIVIIGGKYHKITIGGITLNEIDFLTALKEKRQSYGVTQTRLALMAGISREHLSRIEAGKVALTEDRKQKLLEAVEKFNPDAPMFLLFD